MAATPDQIEQQRGVVNITKQRVVGLLDHLAIAQQSVDTYNRIGLGDGQTLSDEAFVGTGTTRAQYVDAITSLMAIKTLMDAGNGTNLEKFAR